MGRVMGAVLRVMGAVLRVMGAVLDRNFDRPFGRPKIDLGKQ